MRTGYKLRQQISKGLQQRSGAIRNAISRYNVQAAAVTLPRPLVSWKDIVKYTFLGEFDVLRHLHTDVQDCEWTKPAVCEATTKFFKLCRAKEELIRLNVEMRRLRTSIHKEEDKVLTVIMSLLETAPFLARELQRSHRPCTAVNSIHLHRLDQIQKQYGCAESCGTGVRLNRPLTIDLSDNQREDSILDDTAAPLSDMQDNPEPATS